MPRQQVIDFRYARPEVDVWAMAASLYYMLTRQPPRDFNTGRDMFQTVLQTQAIPIAKRNRNVPARLATVIDHALVDAPAIPFKTARELRRALEGVL
jgi:serine/threonine protein kinase